MKFNKKLLANLTLFGALAVGFTIAVNATEYSSWSFSSWHKDSSFPNTEYSSPSWITNSSNNTVTINGWQDTGSSVYPAILDYGVYEDDLTGWGDHWVHQYISGNYPQSGTWYSKQISGVPNGTKVAIGVTIETSTPSSGAGNSYQSVN